MCTLFEQHVPFHYPYQNLSYYQDLVNQFVVMKFSMTFADKSRYDRTFKQVTHKGGESTINYIKRFKNEHALSVSVVNRYSEDQLMHTFLDNFHQGGQYLAQIASHQAELRREKKILTKNH